LPFHEADPDIPTIPAEATIPDAVGHRGRSSHHDPSGSFVAQK
jgi:hypothetical protein